MALNMTINTKTGLTIKNAYIKIEQQSGNKENISIIVRSYVSKELVNGGASWLDEKFYNFTPDVSDSAENFIKQGYGFLKSLPTFKSAVDVLEEGQTA